MTTQNQSEPLTIGTLVRIRNSGYGLARSWSSAVHWAQKGARVYRIRVGDKPPAYTEVLEDQLEVVPTEQ